MCVAIPAIIVKVAKKILAILLGDKKGRKFLGYVVGIALFIVLLPFIAVYGLFGWMAGGGANEIINNQYIMDNLPAEYQEQIQMHDLELAEIATVFIQNGLSSTDISKGKTIYISCLTDHSEDENFYQRYAECFLNRSEESDLYSNISSAFGVSFSDADKEKFNQLYGGA